MLHLPTLFFKIKQYTHVALAVSGGGDSTALMVLFERWKRLYAPHSVGTIFTVDHGLRSSSRKEALDVLQWAQKLGLEGHILTWEGEKPSSRIQEVARKARYDLLGEACEAFRVDALLLGHTRDDQVETFLMRLARGSGIDGLSEMGEGDFPFPVPIIRPLLRHSRSQIRSFLTSEKHPWIEDPSNLNHCFERVRVRALVEHLEKIGFNPAHIALSAKRLRRARQALEYMENSCALLEKDFVDWETFFSLPDEGRIRLLKKLILPFVEPRAILNLSSLEKLVEWIVEGQERSRTLGNVLIKKTKAGLSLSKAPKRRFMKKK